MAQNINWKCDGCGTTETTDGRSLPKSWSSMSFMVMGKAAAEYYELFPNRQTLEYCEGCSLFIVRTLHELSQRFAENGETKD